MKNFYAKNQLNISKHTIAIKEKHNQQNSVLHPVGGEADRFLAGLNYQSYHDQHEDDKALPIHLLQKNESTK